MEEMKIFLVILYILIGLVCSTVEKLNNPYTVYRDIFPTSALVVCWPLLLFWYVPEFITDYFEEKFR